MIKQRIYIDTSVIGGCFDNEFKEYSNKLFEEFITGKKIAVVSNITFYELENAPIQVKNRLNDIPESNIEHIEISTETEALAEKYLKENVISENYKEDALHIAAATIEKVDILASWNFKHIVNVKKIHGYNGINLKEGFSTLEIRSPREVVDDE